MMRLHFSISSLYALLSLQLFDNTLGFQIHHHPPFSQQNRRQLQPHQQQHQQQQQSIQYRWSSKLYVLNNENRNLHEFDYLLREDLSALTENQAAFSGRRRMMVVPGSGSSNYRFTISTSSLAAPSGLTEEDFYDEASAETTGTSTAVEGESAEYDPFAESLLMDSPVKVGKIHQFQEMQAKGFDLEGRLKQMDFQDIVITLIIPAILVFAGVRWTFNRVASKVEANADATLDSFANDMIYHDGDYEEMKLCVSDFSRKLVWMGPAKTDAMLKRYLEMYAKKKTVNPRAISSLSYVFTLFKLSEERAAQVLVSLCKQMGTDRISSAGKLLFFGSRILKSPEGKAALMPIKDLIKSTYRDATVAESLIETSQHAIAEAAYRATVQAGGRDQSTLTVGWEVLGLDKETATRIFEEEKKEGFVTAREAMYGLQTQKYDKKGNRITDDGKKIETPVDDKDDDDDVVIPLKPEDVDENDDILGGGSGGGGDDDSAPTSNVYECSECGYTLFIAQGRESKFFGTGFKCPECGAPKDKFKGRNIGEDDD